MRLTYRRESDSSSEAKEMGAHLVVVEIQVDLVACEGNAELKGDRWGWIRLSSRDGPMQHLHGSGSETNF